MRALALLGVARCSECKQFFRCSDSRCAFRCWQTHLLRLHSAMVVFPIESTRHRGSGKSCRKAGVLAAETSRSQSHEGNTRRPDRQADWKFQIVTTCVECHGSGKLLEGEGAGF